MNARVRIVIPAVVAALLFCGFAPSAHALFGHHKKNTNPYAYLAPKKQKKNTSPYAYLAPKKQKRPKVRHN